jgi:hypothetical protein
MQVLLPKPRPHLSFPSNAGTSSSSIRLPSTSQGVVFLRFTNLHQALPSKPSPCQPSFWGFKDSCSQTSSSDVLSASVGKANQTHDFSKQKVNITFVTNFVRGRWRDPSCAFVTPDIMWSTSGCVLVASDDFSTTCACDHLTSFSILMDTNHAIEGVSRLDVLALDVLTKIGCVTSVLSLALALVAFAGLTSLRRWMKELSGCWDEKRNFSGSREFVDYFWWPPNTQGRGRG